MRSALLRLTFRTLQRRTPPEPASLVDVASRCLAGQRVTLRDWARARSAVEHIRERFLREESAHARSLLNSLDVAVAPPIRLSACSVYLQGRTKRWEPFAAAALRVIVPRDLMMLSSAPDWVIGRELFPVADDGSRSVRAMNQGLQYSTPASDSARSVVPQDEDSPQWRQPDAFTEWLDRTYPAHRSTHDAGLMPFLHLVDAAVSYARRLTPVDIFVNRVEVAGGPRRPLKFSLPDATSTGGGGRSMMSATQPLLRPVPFDPTTTVFGVPKFHQVDPRCEVASLETPIEQLPIRWMTTWFREHLGSVLMDASTTSDAAPASHLIAPVTAGDLQTLVYGTASCGGLSTTALLSSTRLKRLVIFDDNDDAALTICEGTMRRAVRHGGMKRRGWDVRVTTQLPKDPREEGKHKNAEAPPGSVPTSLSRVEAKFDVIVHVAALPRPTSLQGNLLSPTSLVFSRFLDGCNASRGTLASGTLESWNVLDQQLRTLLHPSSRNAASYVVIVASDAWQRLHMKGALPSINRPGDRDTKAYFTSILAECLPSLVSGGTMSRRGAATIVHMEAMPLTDYPSECYSVCEEGRYLPMLRNVLKAHDDHNDTKGQFDAAADVSQAAIAAWNEVYKDASLIFAVLRVENADGIVRSAEGGFDWHRQSRDFVLSTEASDDNGEVKFLPLDEANKVTSPDLGIDALQRGVAFRDTFEYENYLPKSGPLPSLHWTTVIRDYSYLDDAFVQGRRAIVESLATGPQVGADRAASSSHAVAPPGKPSVHLSPLERSTLTQRLLTDALLPGASSTANLVLAAAGTDAAVNSDVASAVSSAAASMRSRTVSKFSQSKDGMPPVLASDTVLQSSQLLEQLARDVARSSRRQRARKANKLHSLTDIEQYMDRTLKHSEEEKVALLLEMDRFRFKDVK